MVLQRLRLIAKLGLWLLREKQLFLSLNENLVARFLDQLRGRQPGCYKGARLALRQLLMFLRDIGALEPRVATPAFDPATRLAEEYRRFLREERGLDVATIHSYSRHVDRFLFGRYGSGRVDLRALRPMEIAEYVRREAPRLGRGHAAQMVTGLRSFFRFARYQGRTRADLAAFVPPVANWALSGLPKHLPAGAVQRVLRHCDRSTVRGKRDYALLLLLARLGLRAGEIVAMRMEDIDWASEELAVRSKKGAGRARLPLPAEVGRALAAYLQVRPGSLHRNVFVRDYAPYSPFVASGPVSVLVRKAIERAGVKSARTGAHVFRHTLATEMLRHGASLDEIGQVLRHRHPDTTAIYAKVDLEALRELAKPWPGGVR
jgi:site-specific recombinase XerD